MTLHEYIIESLRLIDARSTSNLTLQHLYMTRIVNDSMMHAYDNTCIVDVMHDTTFHIDTNCGRDCVRVIDAMCAFINTLYDVRRDNEYDNNLLLSCMNAMMRQCGILIFG